MEDSTFVNARYELNDPNSVYYLGRPSVYEELQNYLHGYGGRGTNYFGRNARNYISRTERDCFIHNKIMNDIEKKNKFEAWAVGIGAVALAGLAYVFRGKIPLIGKFLKK